MIREDVGELLEKKSAILGALKAKCDAADAVKPLHQASAEELVELVAVCQEEIDKLRQIDENIRGLPPAEAETDGIRLRISELAAAMIEHNKRLEAALAAALDKERCGMRAHQESKKGILAYAGPALHDALYIETKS